MNQRDIEVGRSAGKFPRRSSVPNRSERTGKKAPMTESKTMTSGVSLLGLTFAITAVSAAKKAIAENLAKGYNNARPGEPGWWTWESCFAEVAKALGTTFPNDVTAREAGRCFGSAMRGLIPNGAARWASVKPDAAHVNLVTHVAVMAIVVTNSSTN